VSTPSANCQQQQTGVPSLAEEKKHFHQFQTEQKQSTICLSNRALTTFSNHVLTQYKATYISVFAWTNRRVTHWFCVFVTYSSVASSGETKRELTRTEFCHLATMVPAHTLWSIKACQYTSDNNSEA